MATLGRKLELHINQRVPDTATFTNQFHLGFEVPSIDAFIDRLMKEDNEFIEQVNTQDPALTKCPMVPGQR